jgi:hypothetical protein
MGVGVMDLTSRDDILASALQIDIGVVRCFGSGDINDTGLGRGWALPEDAHSWNDGPEAVLSLSTLRPDFRCVLVVEGAPLIGPARARQDVTLYVNGLRLGFWRLTDNAPAQLETLIEPAHWQARGRNAVLNLAFHLPDSVRLSTVQPDGDDRELGFCFRTLALFPAPHER